MADTEVSESNNPEMWEKLYAMWMAEKNPGWVVLAHTTYQVVQKVDTTIVFIPYNAEQLYESTSF